MLNHDIRGGYRMRGLSAYGRGLVCPWASIATNVKTPSVTLTRSPILFRKAQASSWIAIED